MRGRIGWRTINKKQGIQYAFLDQDETAGPIVDSMAASYTYLKGINLV